MEGHLQQSLQNILVYFNWVKGIESVSMSIDKKAQVIRWKWQDERHKSQHKFVYSTQSYKHKGILKHIQPNTPERENPK